MTGPTTKRDWQANPPSSPDEWKTYAALAQRKQAAAARAAEVKRAERAAAADAALAARNGRLAVHGMGVDADGIVRWLANGEPVAGGVRPGTRPGGWSGSARGGWLR